MGKDGSLVTRVADRKGHDRRYALDCSKLKRLGFKHAYDFNTGLRETIAWYQANEKWWRPLKVGGGYRMTFTNFSSGNGHSFGGTYQELVPGERIRYEDRFEDPNLPGEMTTTITFRAVSCGTEMHVVQEGIPEMIPVELCYLGWQESLVLLGKLVEPEIPD